MADDDEEAAVRALTDLGITPSHGWMTDYPVTPQIVAELRQTITDAAAAGRLNVDPESAVSAFLEVVTALGLPWPEESATGQADSTVPVGGYATCCDSGLLDSYYGSYDTAIFSRVLYQLSYLGIFDW